MAPIPEAWGGRIACPPPCVGEEQEAESEGGMEADVLIKQVQTRVYQRRIRSRDAFRDYDRFRCGRCTRQQFARAVSGLCPSLRPEELATLADRFTDDGPKARWPQNVDWLRFCQVVDEVFGVPCLEGRPEVKVPKPGAALPCTAGFRPAPSADEARAREVLRRLALLLRTRGVDLSDCYLYCQRTDAACQVGARGSGKLSRPMFLQRFPFLSDFAERDLDLICQRFAAANGTVDVHALLRAVDAQPEPGGRAEAPAPEGEAAEEEEAEAEAEAEAEEEPTAKGPTQAARRDDGAALLAAPPPPMPRRPSSAESLRRAVSASRLTKDALASEAPRQKAGPSRPSSAFGLRSSASFRSVASQGEKERTLPPRPHSSATSTRSTGSGLRRDAAEVSTPSLDSTLRPGALEEAQAAEADDAPEVEPMEVARPQPQQLQRRASSVTPAAASRPSSGHSRSSSARPASSWPAHTAPAGMPSGMYAAAGVQRPTSATQGPREPWARHQDIPPAPTAADVLAKLRALVAERRLRVSDCFQDSDRLRKGTCTFTQLRTALTLVGLELEPQEYELLFDAFRAGDGGAFRYRDFCAEVSGEAVEVCVHGCARGLTSSRSKAELDQKARSALEDLEGQLRRRAQVRRVELRSTFENLSRARPGHVTRAQFARIMAMHGFRLTEEQVSVICRAYCDTQDQQELNYLLFCDSMEQPRSRPEAGGVAALAPAPPAGAPPSGGGAGPRSRSARYLGATGHHEPGARKHPAGLRR